MYAYGVLPRHGINRFPDSQTGLDVSMDIYVGNYPLQGTGVPPGLRRAAGLIFSAEAAFGGRAAGKCR